MSGTTNRISAKQIEADIDVILALKGIPDYAPHNPLYSVQAANDALDNMRAADEAVILAYNALAAARDALSASQLTVHNTVQGIKSEIKVIYGPDSDEVAAVGLKKKSDRTKRKRSAKPKAKPDA